jgi:hypothetical protein
MRRAKSDNSLMGGSFGGPVKGIARLKANRNKPAAAEVYDFLNARTGDAFDNEHFVERAPCSQRFANRVETNS